jgi:hypothetical protein
VKWVTAILVGFVAWQGLNHTGFCYRQARFLSDAELIRIAVEDQLPSRGPEATIRYRSVDELMRANPNCCQVFRYGREATFSREWIDKPVIKRTLGLYSVGVRVWYRITSDGAPVLYYRSYNYINACGKILDSFGIASELAPLRT